ncbi:MAG: hypothetical protein ACRD12_04225 [Acidimicrobiales bacterium]
MDQLFAVPCAPGSLREIEDGRRQPKLALAIALYSVLVNSQDDPDSGTLALWITTWLAQEIDRECGKGPLAAGPGPAARGVVQCFDRVARGRPHSGTNSRPTLADGIEAFQPLAVIIGDRREWPAKTRGDLFVSSASPSVDLAFLGSLLNRLDHPAQLYADKIVVASDPEYLLGSLNCNLLVVGSPSVNLAARLINGTAPFHFNIPKEWQAWDESVRQNRALGDPQLRELVWWLVRSVRDGATDVDESALLASSTTQLDPERVRTALELTRSLLRVRGPGLRSLREITQAFNTSGILDSVIGRVHANPNENEDYGLVSLARHPFSEDHVAILVAGIHGYGTAHALRLLAEQPGFFRSQPLGAVFRIGKHESETIGWARRLRAASMIPPADVTPAYGVTDVIQKLTKVLEDPDHSPQSYAEWATRDLEACIRFISQFSR